MTAWAAWMRSRWKAGSMTMRERRWKSPSMVSSPSPSSGMRSPMKPSRHEKFAASETVTKWFASGPSIHTALPWSTRIVKTGPKRS